MSLSIFHQQSAHHSEKGDIPICKEGTFLDGCGGCLDLDTGTLEDLVRCCDFIEVGGYGDQLLDWLFGEIISYVKEHYLPGRVLTDRDNIAVIGKKKLGQFLIYF